MDPMDPMAPETSKDYWRVASAPPKPIFFEFKVMFRKDVLMARKIYVLKRYVLKEYDLKS